MSRAIDDDDRLYVAPKACDPANSGIWRVDIESGAIRLIAGAPKPTTFWNGIDVHDGFLYAADSFDGYDAAFPPNNGRPSLMRLGIEVPGDPEEF